MTFLYQIYRTKSTALALCHIKYYLCAQRHKHDRGCWLCVVVWHISRIYQRVGTSNLHACFSFGSAYCPGGRASSYIYHFTFYTLVEIEWTVTGLLTAYICACKSTTCSPPSALPIRKQYRYPLFRTDYKYHKYRRARFFEFYHVLRTSTTSWIANGILNVIKK